MENRPARKVIKYSVIYYFVRFLIVVSNLMPRTAWLAFCGFLGSVACRLARETRERALTHLTLAYHGEKTPREIQELGKRMFNMLGKNAGDVLRARGAVRILSDLD